MAEVAALTLHVGHGRLLIEMNKMLVTLHEQVVLDPQGHPTAIQLPLKEYKRLLSLLEDAVDLDIAKERLKEPRIPLAQVTAELKRDGLL